MKFKLLITSIGLCFCFGNDVNAITVDDLKDCVEACSKFEFKIDDLGLQIFGTELDNVLDLSKVRKIIGELKMILKKCYQGGSIEDQKSEILQRLNRISQFCSSPVLLDNEDIGVRDYVSEMQNILGILFNKLHDIISSFI